MLCLDLNIFSRKRMIAICAFITVHKKLRQEKNSCKIPFNNFNVTGIEFPKSHPFVLFDSVAVLFVFVVQFSNFSFVFYHFTVNLFSLFVTLYSLFLFLFQVFLRALQCRLLPLIYTTNVHLEQIVFFLFFVISFFFFLPTPLPFNYLLIDVNVFAFSLGLNLVLSNFTFTSALFALVILKVCNKLCTVITCVHIAIGCLVLKST